MRYNGDMSYSLPPPPDVLAGEMLPAAPQQARSRSKREALLESGLVLFAELGYEATTIDAVAARAGIAVGGFYQHFSGKRQLLLVLMQRLLAAADTLIAPPASPPADARAAIETLVRAGLQTDWAFAGAYRAWRELAARDAAIRTLDAAIETWSDDRLALLLGGLRALPGARAAIDLPMLAHLLSLLFWRLVERPETDPAVFERTVQTLTDLIARAVFEL